MRQLLHSLIWPTPGNTCNQGIIQLDEYTDGCGHANEDGSCIRRECLKVEDKLDVANLGLELFQLLLESVVLLRHLLVLGLPLVTLVLKSLHLSLEVSGLDVGLSEPRESLC
jgi:hypothetical protein